MVGWVGKWLVSCLLARHVGGWLDDFINSYTMGGYLNYYLIMWLYIMRLIVDKL